MDAKRIEVLPTIFCMEVTTASNNHLVKCYCLNCLSRAKTNSWYKEFKTFPMLSNSRICSACGAMTIQAVVNAFGLPSFRIVSLIERKQEYRPKDFDYPIQLFATPVNLIILKASIQNGKVKSKYK